MFKSATFKLTLWYLAIIVLISLAFSAIVYRMATDQLRVSLMHQSARLSNEFPAFSNNPQFRFAEELSDGERTIVIQLIVLNGFVLICAGVASYFLARRTLTPIAHAHELQKRFTADVSHELRTPLTALRMESEVALLDSSAPKTMLRKALQSNIEEADKMQQLVNNLLRLTKLETDELQAGFSDVMLSKVVAAAVQQTRSAADAKKIYITVGTIKNSVLGDEASLTQLMVILLDNAIKYSPLGSDINVHSRRHDKSEILEIDDKGVGIDPASLKHVFERFYRSDKSRSGQETSGYGLGLSIAKHIVDIHHGVITLKSRTGHGTTASVELPIHIHPSH